MVLKTASFEPHSLFTPDENPHADGLLAMKATVKEKVDRFRTRREHLMLRIEDLFGLYSTSFSVCPESKRIYAMEMAACGHEGDQSKVGRRRLLGRLNPTDSAEMDKIAGLEKEAQAQFCRFMNKYKRYTLWCKERRRIWGRKVRVCLEDGLVWVEKGGRA